jgi:hypothetical protein
MRRSGARLGGDGQGRLWIADPTPACDALITLALVAQTWAQMQLAE